MKKRLGILALTLLLLLAFAACGGTTDADDETNGGDPLPAEVQTIRMVGFQIDSGTMTRVGQFNRQSETHQIEVEDFWHDALFGDFAAIQSAISRMLTEFTIGQGPDIIYVGMDFAAFEPMLRQGMFLDLYPLIDADPDINRSDFLPNILGAGQAPDGSLATISQTFSIHTLVGQADMLPNPEDWTVGAMLDLLEESLSQGMEFPMGKMTRIAFWRTWTPMVFREFVDLDSNLSNFDSDDFIRIMELAARMPQEVDLTQEGVHPFLRILRGELVFINAPISGTRLFQDFMAMGEEVVVVGIPTRDGGVHFANPISNMGIHANSPHAEAAWSFIRQSLLPEARIQEDWGIPSRIDTFEDMIETAMIPFVLDGEVRPTRRLELGDGIMGVDIYAMTEGEAGILRGVVESAIPGGRLGDTVSNIIQEEALAFFAGNRNVEDTVRIIQNRAQTALHERR